MAAGRIQHWKHGWIPISQEAKAFAAGLGPRPGSGQRGPVPNERFGIPATGKLRGDLTGGKRRADEINELMTGVSAKPHFAFASQSMPAAYTGGVVIDGRDADVMIDRFERWEEGTASYFATAKREGLLPRNASKGSGEIVANRRARRMKQLLGLRYAPLPEWEPGRPGTPGHYTGGVIFDKVAADDLLMQLNRRYTGTTTAAQSRRLAGFGG